MTDAFVHLNVHSDFSLIDGLSSPGNIVSLAHDNAMMAVALTDHMNLCGAVKFYKSAIKTGLKPLIGADLVVYTDERDTYTVTALCQNDEGYRHLTELISKAYIEGQSSGQPVIEWSWLSAHAGGLIILSGGPFGDVGQALLSGKDELAQSRLDRWVSVFGDRYYLELMRTDRQNDSPCLHASIGLAEKNKVAVVATNNVRFSKAEDFRAHEARVCIHDGYVLEDHRRPNTYSGDQYFKSQDEMQALFGDVPSALENSIEIAKRCSLPLSLGDAFLPSFPVPDGLTMAEYFRRESERGMIARIGEQHDAAYDARLSHEVDVILEMGFPGYFLIVADFIAWAKSQNIPVGPGRGSGAGSLIAYSLGITELDPIVHELLFERFLNPERVSMPDFDVDFCMDRRDEVIDYVASKYGRECVSQIITFGTMAAKAVIRDVGRVLGMPYGFVDRIAKLVPFEIGMTLEKALLDEDELMRLYQQDDEVRGLIDLAKQLEGVTRNAGKHAGGVVIAPTKLTDFSALYCEAGSDNIVTQYDKDDVESVGLVKFDFLGLRTLTIISWAVDAINARLTAEGKDLVDITQIPLDDKESFALLKSNETSAVFQLESRGMKDLIRRLQPDCFDEITALVALFRPGPLQSGMVDDFIARKHGEAKVVYPHPELEAILKPTYGVILYQEQVMQIAQVLANYTLGGADILRRAMGKKKPEEMARQRIVFTEGAVGRGIDEEVATYIFDLMEKFAGYGFNKSHSAAYALIAYQTAWIKAHYPAEFMAAVLSSDMDNTDKVVGFVDECARMQLSLKPPSVNLGEYYFRANEQGVIVYGLGAVKGVGQAAIDMLVAERNDNGAFESLFDLCARLDTRKLNRRAMDALIRSGSLDCFGQSRAVLSASLDRALQYADQHHKREQAGQTDMFGNMLEDSALPSGVDYVASPDWPLIETLQAEKEVLGFYLSGHPIELFEAELAHFIKAPLAQLTASNKKTVIAGMIVGVRNVMTKSGRRMALVTLEDKTGTMDVTIFSKLYDDVRPLLIKDIVVLVKGEVAPDTFSGGLKMVADELVTFEEARAKSLKRMVIHVKGKEEVDQLLARLPHVIKPYQGGHCPIAIAYYSADAKAELLLGERWRITPQAALLTEVQSIYGEALELEY